MYGTQLLPINNNNNADYILLGHLILENIRYKTIGAKIGEIVTMSLKMSIEICENWNDKRPTAQGMYEYY